MAARFWIVFIAIGMLFLAGKVSPAGAQQGTTDPAPDPDDGVIRLVPMMDSVGKPGRLERLPTPPVPSEEQKAIRDRQRQNPPLTPVQTDPIQPPKVAPTVTGQDFDPVGENPIGERPHADPLPDLSLVDPASLGALDPIGPLTREELRVAASTDFTLFRNQVVIHGGGDTSDVGEPSAHNDRNVILQTGTGTPQSRTTTG